MGVKARLGAIIGTSAVLTAGLVAAPATAVGERTITLAGSLQSELGCPGDWQPDCPQSQLTDNGGGSYSARLALPAGSYEFKVTVNGSWSENYGAGGVKDGPNIPLTIAGPAQLDFAYDDTSHVVRIAPTDLPGDQVSAEDRSLATPSLRKALTKEQFYFVMTDRFANGDPANDAGGLTGDRLTTGLDPTSTGFYHGGDIKGIVSKLDYIKGLGTTAIWLTPSFKNKAVQGDSAGYHGYWITDFTQIDPHLGTNQDMKDLISAAHSKGMKVFFDIITNHTADVIDYEQKVYEYVSKAKAPYKDASGTPFNDEDYVNSPAFPALNTDSFPYKPVFRNPGDDTAKTPAWLNDVTLYHNRGDSTFAGESSTYGDFVGLDDLFTEHPTVEKGMEDIYKAWVDLGIDGFRIDTVKHVNLGFWQKFGPAMLEQAKARGNDDFFMFGEVYSGDPTYLSTFSTAGNLPATLDFGFQDQAVGVANGRNTKALADMFRDDDYYTDADSNAYQSPTFLGNHDMGRVGYFVGGAQDKDEFAHELMYTLRGQPVIYYGDEQGFIGSGGDKAARQDMFASQVDQYNNEPMIAGPSGSADRFNTKAPLYRFIQKLAQLRKEHSALTDGAQVNRFSSESAGVFAVSRIDSKRNVEYLIVANNATTDKQASFATYTADGKFKGIYGTQRSGRGHGHGGDDDLRANGQGTVTVTVPPMSVQVFRADRPMTRPQAAPALFFAAPATGGVVAGRAEIRASVPANTFVQASYAFRPVGTSQWQVLGTDDNAPYRVFHDVSAMAKGSLVEYRVVVKDSAGNLSARSSYGVVGDPPPPPAGPGVSDVPQPSAVTIAGDLDSELGCPGDWQPDCAAAHLTLDPNDNIWKGTFTLPAGSYAYKAAINNSWDENYGAGAVRNGSNISIESDGTPIEFFYDHRTHLVMSSLESRVVVAAGDFQSEMGCSADFDPACMRSWLQDPDGDGTFSLATVQIPPGSYSFKAALDGKWDENYGAGGAANGANIPFTVIKPGSVVAFAFNSASKVPSVTVSDPPSKPDLTVADAYWLDDTTLAYPTSRLPAGTDPASFRYRLHWGSDLAIDATTLGGQSVLLTPVAGAPAGEIALKLPRLNKGQLSQIKAAAQRAVGVYSDADQVVDATSVKP